MKNTGHARKQMKTELVKISNFKVYVGREVQLLDYCWDLILNEEKLKEENRTLHKLLREKRGNND